MQLLAQTSPDKESNLDQGLKDLFGDALSVGTKVLIALVILFVGWIIAKAIRNLVSRGLKAAKFDDWIDKSGLGAPIERAGFADSGVLVAKLIYWLVMLVVFQIAIGLFGDSPVQDVFNSIIAFIPKILVAIIIVIITGVVANLVRDLVAGALSGESYGRAASVAAAGAIWFIGGTAALDALGVASTIVTGVFTAVLGSLSLIMVLKFGIGGIDSARDRFWPKVYDLFEGDSTKPTPPTD